MAKLSMLTDSSMNYLVHVAGKSPTDEHYYLVSPFVLDCSADGDAFSAHVMPEHRQAMLDKLASGELRLVEQLRRTAREYAEAKLRTAYRNLNKKEAAQVQSILGDWQTERRRLTTQLSKPANRKLESGVEILLPFNGIRLPFGAASTMFVH